ncbi:hypothetical protein PR048_011949 [Dryococelus australis]|uniref:Uncharacterized protein n=1 Tax=Dryococelus australis TaxID=614101 RepID=A0ABQ9HMY8_9NEOP|nr:hypothetical protein PR048_011949 [Dryococelus australis]
MSCLCQGIRSSVDREHRRTQQQAREAKLQSTQANQVCCIEKWVLANNVLTSLLTARLDSLCIHKKIADQIEQRINVLGYSTYLVKASIEMPRTMMPRATTPRKMGVQSSEEQVTTETAPIGESGTSSPDTDRRVLWHLFPPAMPSILMPIQDTAENSDSSEEQLPSATSTTAMAATAALSRIVCSIAMLSIMAPTSKYVVDGELLGKPLGGNSPQCTLPPHDHRRHVGTHTPPAVIEMRLQRSRVLPLTPTNPSVHAAHTTQHAQLVEELPPSLALKHRPTSTAGVLQLSHHQQALCLTHVVPTS